MAAKKKCPSQFYRSAESLFLLLINLFILFLAALGLRCCARAFFCGERGLLFIAVRALLMEVASLAVEHRL